MSPGSPMTLTISLPERTLLRAAAVRVAAEGAHGAFGLRPRHVDAVVPLVPGILAYAPADAPGEERFVAVGAGLLVKCGADVRVSVRRAVAGDDLGTLEATVREEFETHDEHETAMHDALAKLEVDLMRRFTRLGRPAGRGGA
jgi:F-type H+-transporting ATPase subunit epsilon